jgi:hypothetical protein
MQSAAHALTMTECSAKYKDAKAAGTLNGATWNDFRKSQCDLAPAKGSSGAAAAANAVFPTAVDAKYSSEKPGARGARPASINTRPTRRPIPRRFEMAAEGWRLLQPVRQEAQRRGVT